MELPEIKTWTLNSLEVNLVYLGKESADTLAMTYFEKIFMPSRSHRSRWLPRTAKAQITNYLAAQAVLLNVQFRVSMWKGGQEMIWGYLSAIRWKEAGAQFW
ncbi:hypothetical protein J6590_013909 [Homalodisca vitripennis]|nr:hypothetical protein J6590_013909 [Homalodisca vitripennis]